MTPSSPSTTSTATGWPARCRWEGATTSSGLASCWCPASPWIGLSWLGEAGERQHLALRGAARIAIKIDRRSVQTAYRPENVTHPARPTAEHDHSRAAKLSLIPYCPP